MIEYDYEDYFYTGSHHKHLLFVEQDANVTKSSGKPPKVTLPGGGTPLIITNENIIKESFELEEVINSAENWSFGSVEPSMITFTIREDKTIPYLENQAFRLYLYFDNDSSTLMYIGSYVFDSDTLSNDSKSREISGFDFVQSIRDINVIDWYRGLFNAHEAPDPEDPDQKIWVPSREKIKVKEARDSLFKHLSENEGLPIVQETVSLPNDNFEFAFDVDTEALSAGQILEDLCEINGRYGHFGRQLSTAEATKNYAVFQYILIPRYDTAGTKIGNSLRYNGMKKGLYETKSIKRIRVYNRDSELIGYYDEGYTKSYSKYNIFDNILIDNLTKNKTTKTALKAMLKNIYNSVRYRKYVPFESKFPADLCREVGDRITLWTDIDIQSLGGKTNFKTLIFKRRITGIQNMVETYSANGDKKLPEFGDYSSSGGYGTKSGGSGLSSQYGSDNSIISEPLTLEDLIEYNRNFMIRVPDEPTGVDLSFDVYTPKVSIKWSDPGNIETEQPVESIWAGTVVVRKADEPPKNIWDGDIIVNSTTRDQYKTNAYDDTTVEVNRFYYYGIFPYDENGNYRPTKIVEVDTSEYLDPPEIIEIVKGGIPEWDGSELDILWSGNNNKLTAQISSGTILFKMYILNTVIYSFTSPVGSSAADVKKVHVAFLKDDTNEVAKPSFVYHTGTGTYSYNQESPTDTEMADIYTWLSAGI